MDRPKDIIEAISKPEYFGKAFKDLETWQAWLTFLRVVYGIPLVDDQELATFRECTKREAPLVGGHKEIYAVCGRRGGKSRIMSTIAAFEALWGGWAEGLAPGENAFIFLIAFDKTQAKQLFNYTKGLLEPFMTKEEKNRVTSDTIELKKQRTAIMIKAGLFQAVRGFSTAVILLDELAFARSETSAQPVDELIAALTPSIMENGLLVGASTPFAASGYLYEQYDSHFGHDEDEVLCWHGTTMRMNPSFSEKKIARDIRKDKIRYESEYYATFRSDIENFLPKFVIEAAMKDHKETMPEAGRRYECFVDASGGRSDSYCMALGFRDGDRAVVARLLERQAPFDDPAEVTKEFAAIAKLYGVKRITADRYAGNWVSASWEKHGITVERSALAASDLYLELQPLISMGRVALVKHDRLLVQLQQLERRALPGGKDVVSHPDGTHDDLANCVAGLCVNLLPHRLWTLENMPLPVKSEHRADKVMSPSLAAGRRREEIRASAEEEMRIWLGGSPKLRR